MLNAICEIFANIFPRRYSWAIVNKRRRLIIYRGNVIQIFAFCPSYIKPAYRNRLNCKMSENCVRRYLYGIPLFIKLKKKIPEYFTSILRSRDHVHFSYILVFYDKQSHYCTYFSKFYNKSFMYIYFIFF